MSRVSIAAYQSCTLVQASRSNVSNCDVVRCFEALRDNQIIFHNSPGAPYNHLLEGAAYFQGLHHGLVAVRGHWMVGLHLMLQWIGMHFPEPLLFTVPSSQRCIPNTLSFPFWGLLQPLVAVRGH